MIRALLYLLLTALVIAALCYAGFKLYRKEILATMANELIVKDELKKADLIVALGGENLRRKEAVRLFSEGYGRKIVFTGFEIEKEEYIRYGLKPGDYIHPVGFAANTYEEAVVIGEIARKNRYRSVLVVTSFFHTRRAQYIFSKILERDQIEVRMYPVYNKAFDVDQWWKNSYLRKVVALEWLGLLYYWFEY